MGKYRPFTPAALSSKASVQPVGYAYEDSPDTIADHLRSILADGSTACPLCGNTFVHQHMPEEIVIYRNGVKYGRSLNA